MERVPVTLPRACYGLEQHADNPLCPKCPHRTACADLMGKLANRTAAHRANFRFLPNNLAAYAETDVYSLDPDAAAIEQAYLFCHEWVYGYQPKNKIGRHRLLILERVRQSDTSLKLFLLANLLGWNQSHSGEAFPSSVLTGEFAVRQVKKMAHSCRQLYGTFDTTSLDQLTGSEISRQDFEQVLLKSEMTVGSWILGYTMHQTANLVKNLYQELETDLDPHWLAVEPTYYGEVFEDHLFHRDPELSPTLVKHRWNVSYVMARLKRHARLAAYVFRARESIMPEAIFRVLGLRGYQADDFYAVPGMVVTHALNFWAYLGRAVRQVELLKFVNREASIFDRFNCRSA